MPKLFLLLLALGLPFLTFSSHAEVLPSKTLSATQIEAGEYLKLAIASYEAKDYAKAKQLFNAADQAGHFKAKRYLGLMFLNGFGVEKDATKAFNFFQQASDNGDLTAQYWLGYLYENGIGTVQNWFKAGYFYELSAVRGLTDDCAKEAHCNPAVSAPAMLALANLERKTNQLPLALTHYQKALTMKDEEVAHQAKIALQQLGSNPLQAVKNQ